MKEWASLCLHGITAFIAFIDGLTNEFHNNIFLAYGARKPELLLYRDSIDAKAGANNGFHASYFVETDDKNKSGSTKGQSPEFFTGCLSLETIWNQLENPREAIYYIAGPPAMIQALTGNLLKKDISPEMIKVDAWE